ncbi:MAG: hypothetical protein PHN52_13045 [candidate division Zixibacteria bacterium]|nr:hypothetical protein [candidate division Zixibacteria bacterium]
MSIWSKFEAIDRRWIYLLVALSVIIPFILPVKFPVYITPESQQLFEAVDSLPENSVVLLTFDYYPSTIAETEPMSRIALHHLFRKNIRVVTMTTVPLGGPSMAEQVTRELAAQYGKVYGVDYVNLGYKANYVAVLKGLGSSIEAIYPTDNTGTPLRKLPLMDNVKNYDDMAFIYVVSDNGIVDYWISIVNALYGIPVGCGVTAVMAPKFYAFVSAGQMTGLLGGMKGAAEYEKLLGRPARATSGMDAQSLLHLLIIALVIAGNVGYFVNLHQKGKNV